MLGIIATERLRSRSSSDRRRCSDKNLMTRMNLFSGSAERRSGWRANFQETGFKSAAFRPRIRAKLSK